MFKRLALCVLLVVVMAGMVFAEGGETKFIKIQIGATGTVSQTQTAHVNGLVQAGGMFRLWGDHFYGGLKYQDINNVLSGNWNTGDGMIYIFTRNPTVSLLNNKPQIYGIVGAGVGHEEESGKFIDAGTLNTGLGLLVPTPIGDFTLETTGYMIGDKWTLNALLGVQWGF